MAERTPGQMAPPLDPQPAQHHAAQASEPSPDQPADAVQVSPTGAIMGKPGAEHGMYGMVREGTADAEALTEREIRGVEPGKPAALP